MAKATTVIRKMEIDPEKQRKEDLRAIEDVLLDNREGITDLLKLLQRFQHKEVFHMAESMIGQSDKILERVVLSMDHPEITRSLKNMLLLFEALGKVNVDELEPMIQKLNNAVSNIAEYDKRNERASYLNLISAMKDKEVVDGINVMVALVKGFGSSTNNAADKYGIRPPTIGIAPQKANKWLYFLGGAMAVAVPLLLRKNKE